MNWILVRITISCMITNKFLRSEEDSPNDYESSHSSHSEEERPTTEWPNVIVCRYPESETTRKIHFDLDTLSDQQHTKYDKAICQ